MQIRVLSVHSGYACRHSGACCRAGWRIPLDERDRDRLEAAASTGRLPRTAALAESRGRLTVLRLKHDGTCTAFEPPEGRAAAMCAIHRALGHESLPSACRHFPRVCLLERRGVSIALSHYCPTAAAMLFVDRAIAVEESPPGFTQNTDFEGLDARDALPPLLAPGILMDAESYAVWESWALGVLGDGQLSADRTLGVLRNGADRCRGWNPRRGALLDVVRSLGSDPAGSDPVGSDPCAKGRFCEVVDCLAEGIHHAHPPRDYDRLDREFVAPQWRRWDGPLRRYLAARLHASWVPYQGQGLLTVVESLAAALAVVRVEAARECGRRGTQLEREALLHAFRMADLLLVHEADAQALATRWSRAERESSGESRPAARRGRDGRPR